MVQKMNVIWLDGALVPWDEANVHILTHTLHYGVGAFEGIRAYKCNDSAAVFRLREHIDRLFDSTKILHMTIPFTREQVVDACVETLKANGMAEGYIRPLAFIGHGAMGVHPKDNPVRLAIATWPWGAYLGAEALEQGIRITTSSYIRHHVNIMMTKSKACGNYVNSVLAKMEAISNGYDEALLLDPDGFVAEGSGENVFIVRRGKLMTPPLTSVLEGITRSSVLELAAQLGIPAVEERFTRDMVYTADEAFFTGTAAELTPIREYDRRVIGPGKAGPITKQIQAAFFKIVKGQDPTYERWLHRYSL